MDAFVTCIYNGLANTEYGGRNMRDARYRESLINIANTGAKIFCFTNARNFKVLHDTFEKYSNIELVIKELDSLEIHEPIQRIKQTYSDKYSDLFWHQRCVEIMWGKFYMINDILYNRPEYTKIFWIDAGLFHNDVISPKYFLKDKKELKGAGIPLFNTLLMKKLNNFVEDKLLLMQQLNPHNKPIDTKYNKVPYKNTCGAVGGLFGGNSESMKIVCKEFFDKMKMVIQDEELCSEESILSAVYTDNEELFKVFKFSSWYHEGWADRHIPGVTTFSTFFDEVLDREKVKTGIVFCTLATSERFRNSAKNLVESFLQFAAEDISLLVFTDEPSDFDNSNPRVLIRKFEPAYSGTNFHYGLKYKVIQDTHYEFDMIDKILYLDADCLFVRDVSSEDFSETLPGLNIPLGNPMVDMVNPAIMRKYKAMLPDIINLLNPETNFSNTKQFRECCLLFEINDKYKFNNFLGEWQLLYEFSRDNDLAFSGECVEISFASLKSEYKLIDMKGLFKKLKSSIHTIILNNPTQAIF